MTQANAQTYDKANSILEIRVDKSSESHVLQRIAHLRNTISEQKDERKMLILRACDDLLGRSASPRFLLRPHVVEEISRLPDSQLARYIHYRYRYEVNPPNYIVDDYPPCVQIEPTSICNYRCVFCYQTDASFTKKKNGHMGFMSLDTFKRVVDEIEGNVEAVTLASRGEPLLTPKIDEMLAYLRGKFLAVKVNTNASALNEKLAHAILESELQTLVFSADAAAEPLYSKLRVKGNLDRVLGNIERFRDIKEKHYPDSQLITRVSGVRYSEAQNINKMEKFWGQLVDQVAFVDYNPWENAYECPSNEQTAPCSDLWRRIFVWWDGRVNPCDVDYKSELCGGNILGESLSEVWTGDAMTKLRDTHLKNKRQALRPCSGCAVI